MSRAFSMERRLEKTKSWNRCSEGSSKSIERSTSLDSGVMLWRLNHELLPDPGRPTASTTIPFEGCWAGGAEGVTLALGTGRAGLDSVVDGDCCAAVCCPGRF